MSSEELKPTEPLAWLKKPSGITREEPFFPFLTKEPTNLEYFAELIYCNEGSMVVKNYGAQQIGLGCYGRMGLLIQEAFLLHDLNSYLAGLYDGRGEPESTKEAVWNQLQGELVRAEKAFIDWLKSQGVDTSRVVLPTPEEVRGVVDSSDEMFLRSRGWRENPNGTWSNEKHAAVSKAEAMGLEK